MTPASPNRHTQTRQKCGFNTHFLDDDHVLLTDPKLINFMKLSNREFRANWPLCRKCANSLALGYHIKMERAKANYRKRKLIDVSSETSDILESSHSGELGPASQTPAGTTAKRPARSGPAAFIEDKLRKAVARREQARQQHNRNMPDLVKKYLGRIHGG